MTNIFARVAEALSRPSVWTSDADALDFEGKPVEPDSEHACRWSGYGALIALLIDPDTGPDPDPDRDPVHGHVHDTGPYPSPDPVHGHVHDTGPYPDPGPVQVKAKPGPFARMIHQYAPATSRAAGLDQAMRKLNRVARSQGFEDFFAINDFGNYDAVVRCFQQAALWEEKGWFDCNRCTDKPLKNVPAVLIAR